MRLTVIPEDRTIIKDGVALQFDFPADANIHAIQWYGDAGTIEQKVGGSVPATLEDISPFLGAYTLEEERLAALAAIVPPPPKVTLVSSFQARAALYQMGLLDDVEALMASPSADPLAKLAWSNATEFRRNSPTVESMKPLLGLTDAQLDDLFRFASTIYA